ncbi:DUF262 domain-containing protein [Deinococcus petrolearius]|uniref:DUF262 domain-containing protein n=1 Tax=Deinococcus petrolearius TaxID=1751295 RepID=A0ABW1DN21_9DEIO
MRPEKRGVLELFERSQRYVIPLYQRRYVWTQEKQWEPLWNDIRLRAEAETDHRQRVKPHFLGAVVLAKLRTFGRELEAFDVIDGQQRLTTFQLFLAAFRDVARELDLHVLDQPLRRVTVNDGLLSQDLERFKVWPTRFDQPGFHRVLDRVTGDPIEEEVQEARRAFRFTPNTMAAYAYFIQTLRSWLSQDSDPARRAEALFNALRRHLQVVTIELEEDDDPQVIFETLNARGEPLQPADLVRNHVFSDAARRRESVHTLFDQYWAPFDEDGSLWQTNESRGRLIRPQLAWFLTAFLTVKLEEDITDNVIFDAFKRWWSSRGPDASTESGLKELLRYAQAYQQLLESPPSSRLGVLHRRLKVMDISTLTPLLLFLLTDTGLAAPQLDLLLDDLESFVIRRFALGLGSKNYNLLFVRLLRELRQLPEESDLRDYVMNFLSRGVGDSVRWPGDSEWRDALLTAPLYKKVRPRGVAMLLEAIDLHLTTGKQESLLIAGPLSVEHVLPQRWTQWPDPVAPDGIPDARAWRNTLLHTIGNLTLTTQKLNTSLSNAPYEKKRGELAQQSRLRLNTLFQTQMQWDEQVIQQRSLDLADILIQIWHGPAGLAQPVESAPAVVDVPDTLTAVAELQESLVRRPIPDFWVEAGSAGDGLLLFSNHWGTRSVRYHIELVEDDAQVEWLKVSLRDTFSDGAPQKPHVQAALARLALSFQQTFGHDRTQVTPTELSVWLPDTADATTLRRALERLVILTRPALEQAAAQTRNREERDLDRMINHINPSLPDSLYFMVADIGTEKKWRRLTDAEWPSQVHYELELRGSDILLHLHDELPEGTQKSLLGSAWDDMVLAAQADQPGADLTAGVRPSGIRWLTLSPSADVTGELQSLSELNNRLQQLMTTTRSKITSALATESGS